MLTQKLENQTQNTASAAGLVSRVSGKKVEDSTSTNYSDLGVNHCIWLKTSVA